MSQKSQISGQSIVIANGPIHPWYNAHSQRVGIVWADVYIAGVMSGTCNDDIFCISRVTEKL